MKREPLQDQAMKSIRDRQRHRWWKKIVAGMSAVVVFVTSYLLILPAITMGRQNPSLEAAKTLALPGETLTVTASIFPEGRADQVYYIAAYGDNAGLTGVSFRNDTASVALDGGGTLTLHREVISGGVGYWFTLPAGAGTSQLSLNWINGIGALREIAVPAETPVPSESPVVETPAPSESPVVETPAPSESPVIDTPAPSESPIVDTPAPSESPIVDTPAPSESPIVDTPAPSESPIVDTPAPSESPVVVTPTPSESPATATPAIAEAPSLERPSGGETAFLGMTLSNSQTAVSLSALSAAEASISASSTPAADSTPAAAASPASLPSEESDAQDAAVQYIDQAGDPAAPGSLTLSAGNAGTLDAARVAATAGSTLTLRWDPEAEALPTETPVPEDNEAEDPSIEKALTIPEGVSSWAAAYKPQESPEPQETQGPVANGGARSVMLLSARSAGTDLRNYLTTLTVERKVGDQWQEATQLYHNDSIRVTLAYELPEGVATAASRVFFYQITGGVMLSAVESGDVLDGNEQVGTYTISTEGLVTITFNENYVEDGTEVHGSLRFEGMVTATGEGEDVTIDFGGSGTTIPVAPDPNSQGLSIVKYGTFYPEVGNIGYSIIISTDEGSDVPITVTDQFQHTPEYGTIAYDEGSFVIQHGTWMEETESWSIDPHPVTGWNIQIVPQDETTAASFTITGLPALQAKEGYAITYTATPHLTASGDDTGYAEFNNLATAADNTDTVTASAKIKVSNAKISKTGTYNPLTGTIVWTILINQDRQDISGMELSDKMGYFDAEGKPVELPLPETVTLTPYDASGNPKAPQSISLPYPFPEGSTDAYMVTYETAPPALPEGTPVTVFNQAFLGRFVAEAKVTGEIPGETGYAIVKYRTSASMGSDVSQFSWESVITYPSDIQTADNLTYVDWIANLFPNIGGYPPIAGTHHTTKSRLQSTLAVLTAQYVPIDPSGYSVYVITEEKLNEILPVEVRDDATTISWYLSNLDFNTLVDPQYWTPIQSVADNTALSMFKIVFNDTGFAQLKAAGNGVVIRYSTQVDMDQWRDAGFGDVVMVNQGRFPYAYAPAWYDLTLEEKLNKQASPTGAAFTGNTWDGNGQLYTYDTTSYTDGDLSLAYHETGGRLHYRILLNGSYLAGKDVIQITDHLPNGATLDPDSIQIMQHLADKPQIGCEWDNSTNWYLRWDMDENTNTITFTFQPRGFVSEYDDIGIYYDVLIEETQGDHTYTNTAVWDGSSDNTHTTVRDEEPVLDKTSQILDESSTNGRTTVRYYVVVNPRGEDLVPNNNAITLEDVLTVPDGVSAAFDPVSVHVYAYAADKPDDHYCGRELSDFLTAYDQDTYTITFTLPDSRAMVVVYDYIIDQGSYATNFNILNTANLTGYTYDGADFELLIQYQDSSATANKATLTVYKHASNSITNLLDGASFRLERYEKPTDGSSSYQWAQTSVTSGPDGLFTIEDGSISLSFLEETSLSNTLYRLTEVTQPTGYVLDETPHYFVWLGSATDTEASVYQAMTAAGAIPNGVTQDDILFIPFSTSGTMYISNEPIELVVRKAWQDMDDIPIDPPANVSGVTIRLWQYDKNDSTYKQQYEEDVTLSAENNWRYAWTLPKADEGGTRAYYYKVEELDVPGGYIVSYSPSNEAQITSGEIAVFNQKVDFVLPETGGYSGPLWYTAGGMTLVILAGLLFKRLRRRETRTPTP